MRYTRENGWKSATKEVKKEIFDFSEGYKHFLNIGKTEREFVRESIKLAEQNGFKNIEEFEALKAGDKVYSWAIDV